MMKEDSAERAAPDAPKRANEDSVVVRKVRPRRHSLSNAPFTQGARVGARFVHNGVPTWFFGEVKSGAPSKWSVVFDDGDEKTVPEYLLKHEDQVKLEQQDAAQVAAVEEKLCLELLASTHRVQEAGTQLAYGFDQLAKEATSSDETAKVKAEVKAEVKTEAKTEARTEAKSVELSATKEDPQPLPPASRPKVHVKVEYEEHSCQVKDEHEQEAKGGAKRIKDAHTMSREALRRRLQFEPDGVTPRAVFRAGCHPRCLTQVLGGVGTDNQRFVREDKVLPDGHVLIREGEMYLWGRADWNTYAPSFAGDVGAYRDDLQQDLKDQQLAMGWAEPQAVFHLFRECTKRFLIDMPLSAYHGKDAEKKTLYCGRYRVDNEITYQQTFNELPPCTQECICELAARREIGGSEAAQAQRERRARDIMAEKARENLVYTMHGVEFVDYDEKLYRALVASGASNGRVEVNDVKLGPL